MRRHISVWLIRLLLTIFFTSESLPSAQAQPLQHPNRETTSALIGEIAFTSNRSGKYQIYVMNADGSNLVQVTPSSDTDNFGPYLSPDGHKILFSSGSLTTGDYGFKVIGTDGLHMATITLHGELSAAHPQWSPDSTRIIFGLLSKGSVDFYLVNADGTNRVKLTYPTPSGVPQVKWVSNTQIMLTTVQGLMLAAPDATDLKPLVPNVTGSFALNSQLALEAGYVQTVDGPMKTVDIADASGANSRRQFALPIQSILYYLDWSPDGHYVGIHVRGVSGKDQLDGYYVYDTITNNLFRATSDIWAVWSPDSSYLSYTGTAKNGSYQVYIIAPYPGATPQQITFGDYNNAQPTWSLGTVSEAVF